MEANNKGKFNLKKATFYVMIILAFSRVLGMVREMVIANTYGSGMESDAFYAAFTIPDLMYDLLVAGALSSGFMPVFNSYISKDDENGAWKSASVFITVTIIFILSFNLIGVLFAQWLVPLVSYGSLSDPEEFALTVKLTRIMFSAVTFTALAGLSKGILESYKIFVIPALGPVIYNMGFILGAVVLGRYFGIEGLCIGVVLGAIGNLCIQLPKFTKAGKGFWLSLDVHDKGFREMMMLMLPALIALAVNRLNLVVNQNVVSFLEEGSRTELRYAQRLMMLPVGIFGAGVMTTIFPTMNAQIATERYEDFKDTLCQGLRNALFLTIPSAVGLMVLNYPIIRLLFLSGKFTEYNVSKTALALFFYAFGVIGNAAVPILIRGFYSRHDTKTPLGVGILVVLTNLVLNMIFVKHTSLGVGGVALTSAAVAFLEMVVLYTILSVKMKGMRTREILTTTWKACASAIAMGAVAFMASRFVESRLGTATKTAQLIDVVLPVGLGILVYFIAASLLKMPELEFFLGALKKKIKRS